MAVAVTPYQQNDYQAANSFRPYRLPVNDIFKANVAINEFWDEGARRVKSVYDSTLDLKLSLAGNQEVRDQFMKDAEKQVTKLSSMNLADPSVQKQGLGIFKPLFSDEGIISDDAATRHIDKVNNDALSYRSKDGGKNYNLANHQYALTGADQFKNSTDRLAGKAYLQNKKDYEPFHDYTDEMDQALKGCKPDSGEYQRPSYSGEKGDQISGYMKNTSLKELSAAKARICIEAGISSKAYRQLQIEGAVNYRNNPEVLGADTQSYLGNVSQNLSRELQKVAGEQTAIRTDKTIPAADKQKMLDALDQKAQQLSKEINGNAKSIEKIDKGDLSEINANFDQFAGSIYTYKKLYKRSLAAAFKEESDKLTADPVQMNYIKFNQDKHLKHLDYQYDVSLKEMDQTFDREMKLFDLMYGGGKNADGTAKDGKAYVYRDPRTGELVINPSLEYQQGNIGQGTEPEQKAYEELNEKLSGFNKAEADNNKELYNKVIERGNSDPAFQKELMTAFNISDWDEFKAKTAGNQFHKAANGAGIGIHQTPWFQNYFPKATEDPAFNQWATTASTVTMGINTLKRKLEMTDDLVWNRLKELNPSAKTKEEFFRGDLKKQKPLVIGGRKFTAEQMKDIADGKSVDGIGFTEVEEKVGPGFTTVRYITLNGEKNEDLQNYYSNVQNMYSGFNEKVAKKRAEIIGEQGFARDRWAFTPDDKSPLVDEIRRRFPTGDDKDTPNKLISISMSDFNGGVKINHPGITKDNQESILNEYRNLGYGKDVSLSNDGMIILRNTKHNLVPMAIQNPVLKDIAFQISTVASSPAFQKSESGQRIKDVDIDIPVFINGKQRNARIETHNSGGAPSYQIHIDGTPTVIHSNNAYDLMEQFSMLSQTLKVKMTPPPTTTKK